MTSDLRSVPSCQLLSSEIQSIVEEIAKEANLKDFEVNFKEDDFTGDNYIGKITRIKVEALKNDQKTINLIMKSAPTTPGTREAMPISTYYENEIYTYTDVLPTLDKVQEENSIPAKDRFAFAKLYKSSMEKFQEMMVMKDLSDDGFVMHNKRTLMDFEHLSLVIKNIARFHATSFVLKEKDPAKFSSLADKLPHSQNYGERMSDLAGHSIETIISSIELKNRPRLESFTKDITGPLISSLDASLTDPYNVICHGDCWSNNMLFKYEDGKVTDVILIDWQVVRFASPVTDIAYMLFLAMDENLLELHLDDLLDLYYSTLQKNITLMGCDPNNCYPEEVFREHCETKMVFGLVMALVVIPYTLTEVNEAKNMDDVLADINNGASDVKISNITAERLNSLVRYFVKHDMI